MSSADQAQPTAQGDLGKTPFAHLVLYLHREALSGTLVIDRGGFETKVLFRNGRAVAARPLPRGTALQDGLLELCALEACPYTFWDGDLLGDPSGVIQGTVDALTFVTDSLRSHVRAAVVASVLDRYRGVALRLATGADPKRLGIRGPESRAAERLREHSLMPDDFISRSELSNDESRRLLYLLLITRTAGPEGVDLTGGSGVRAAVASEPAPAPHSSSIPPASIRPGSTLPSQAPSAPSQRPATSQRPPSGSAHPAAAAPQSPLPLRAASGPAAAPSTPAASRPPTPASPFSMPAWQRLASLRAGPVPSHSMSPPPAVIVPSAAPPPVETLDNEGKYRRAEQLAERRNFDEAMRILDELVARDATSADYQALRAWILYQQFTGTQPSRLLHDAIERALRLNEAHPRALYIKALVLKRMGKEVEAIRHFQRTLEADPRHLEAKRELRLAKMRREQK
jgi:hypothetical protein